MHVSGYNGVLAKGLVAQIADSFVVSLLVFEMESSLLQGPLHVQAV